MSRPLRIEEPGLWHHVMNRGQSRRAVFAADADFEGFLTLIGDIEERWGIRPHAYCLMTNHYHLLVEDPRGALSRALQHLDGVHTQRFNRRHHRDGAVFRGRFRSRVVQAEDYVVEVARYIHANPVAAGMVRTAGEYAWSSHRHYLSRLGRPSWLAVDHVLGSFGGDTAKGRRELDAFVHERAAPAIKRELEAERWSPLLGTKSFVEEWRARLRGRDVGRRESVSAAGRLCALDPDAVIDAACDAFGVKRAALLAARRGETNLHRHMALLACRRLTSATGAELASLFGLRPPSVSVYAHRARGLISTDAEAARTWRVLEKRLRACELPGGGARMTETEIETDDRETADRTRARSRRSG